MIGRRRCASMPAGHVMEDRVTHLPPTAENARSVTWPEIEWTLQRWGDPVKNTTCDVLPTSCFKHVTCAGPCRGTSIGQFPEDEVEICSLSSLRPPVPSAGPP